MTGKQFIGFCKAKKKFYYGFKIHIITTDDGKPVEFIITPASTADITAFKLMEIDLPRGASIYGDKAYTHYSFEDDFTRIRKDQINCRPKEKCKKATFRLRSVSSDYFKKKEETTFSQLTSMLPRKIHATTKKGFLLKLVIFIVSFSIE